MVIFWEIYQHLCITTIYSSRSSIECISITIWVSQNYHIAVSVTGMYGDKYIHVNVKQKGRKLVEAYGGYKPRFQDNLLPILFTHSHN